MVNLTIGGGNFKGISYLGALEYLYKNDLLNKIENFYGSSVGTIIGIFFIIGFEPFNIFNILLNLNFENFWDFNFSNLQNSFSLINDSLFKKIKEIFCLKEKADITFIEFYNKYQIKLNIFATSLKQRKNICFNLKYNPNMKILTALQASCSIPIIFPPVKIDDDLFIDGCIKCIDGVCSKVIEDNKINFIIKGSYNYKNIKTFSDYISEIISCTMQNEEILETDYTINIKCMEEFKNKYNFNDIKPSDKIKLYYFGIIETKKKIDKNLNDIKLKINEEILENLKKNKDKEIIKENTTNTENKKNINTINDQVINYELTEDKIIDKFLINSKSTQTENI